MITSGDVISYMEMCQEEGATLQRGMNFRFKGGTSVILMSLRRGAPYEETALKTMEEYSYMRDTMFRVQLTVRVPRLLISRDI